MNGTVFVYITCASLAEAETIGRALVAERFAACVNMVPGMRSIYRWQGRIEQADEVVMIAKTATARFAALEARVRALHSYSVPCIVALPVVDGSAAYLAWIMQESTVADGGADGSGSPDGPGGPG